MDIETLFSRCYVPYSRENGIAAVKSREKRWFPGVRVENIVYPLTITAAQNALFNCLSEGDRPETVLLSDTGDSQLPFWEREFNVRAEELDASTFSEPGTTFADIVLPGETGADRFLPGLLENAIAIQSDFPVAALLETDEGMFSGVNIECSSWNMGMCAERVAIAKAISYGAEKFLSMQIHTRDGEFSSPCGACRQVILEHLPLGRIHLYHADYSKSSYFSRDLLPYSFCSSTLKKPDKKNS